MTRPLNAVTEIQPYVRNGKVYKLQNWYIYANGWSAITPITDIWAVTTKPKAVGGRSSHHLQGAGAYCGCTACYV